MTRDELLDELVAERYGSHSSYRQERPPRRYGDDELTKARRRRALNAAMAAPETTQRGKEAGWLSASG